VPRRAPNRRCPPAGGEIHHVRLAVDRGMSYTEASAFLAEVEEQLEVLAPGRRRHGGFYMQGGNHRRSLNGVCTCPAAPPALKRAAACPAQAA
jgi:hypothetical protein